MPAIPSNTAYEFTSATQPLKDDEADHLYFECRDSNYAHAQAVSYVKENGALPDWQPPRASDYQGLPDVQKNPSSSKAMLMLTLPDHALKPQTEEQKQHQTHSARDRFNTLAGLQATDSFTPSFPTNLDYLTFTTRKPSGAHKQTRYAYRVQIRESNPQGIEECDKTFFFKPSVPGSEKAAYDKAIQLRNDKMGLTSDQVA